MKIEKCLNPLLICTFILIVFAIDPNAYLSPYTPKEYLFVLLSGLLLIIWVIIKKTYITITVIEILLILQLIWMGITNPLYFTHSGSINGYVIFSFFIIVFLTRQLAQENLISFINNLLRILWLCGAIQAGWGWSQWFLYHNTSFLSIKTAMTGSIGMANAYGTFLAVALVASLNDFRIIKERTIKSIIILSDIIIVIALINNGCRGALFALFIALCILAIFYLNQKEWFNQLHRNRFLILVLTVIMLTGILTIGLYLYNLNPESSSGRLMEWRITLPMVMENPITGVGQGNVGLEYLNYQAQFFDNPLNANLTYKAVNLKLIHNEFLQTFCETGLIGGMIFLLIWIVVIYNLLTAIKARTKYPTGYYYIFLILCVILIHSLVDTPLHVIPIALFVSISFGLVPVKSNKIMKVNIQYIQIRANRNIRIILFLFVLIYFFHVLYRVIKQYPAYYDWQHGIEFVDKLKWQIAVGEYKKALSLLPERGELQFHLGSALMFAGQPAEGCRYLEKALSTFNDRNIHISLAYANLQLGNYVKAQEYALTALRMFPDHLAPHLILGEIYYALGEIDKSKKSLKKCIDKQTHIQSQEVNQIARDAYFLWKKYYIY